MSENLGLHGYYGRDLRPSKTQVLFLTDFRLRHLGLTTGNDFETERLAARKNADGTVEYVEWSPTYEDVKKMLRVTIKDSVEVSFVAIQNLGKDLSRGLVGDDLLGSISEVKNKRKLFQEVWLSLGGDFEFFREPVRLHPLNILYSAFSWANFIAQSMDRLSHMFPHARITFLGQGKGYQGPAPDPSYGSEAARDDVANFLRLGNQILELNILESRVKATGEGTKKKDFEIFDAFKGWDNGCIANPEGDPTKKGLTRFVENLRGGPGSFALAPAKAEAPVWLRC